MPKTIRRCVGTQAVEPKIPKELLAQLISRPINQSEYETIYRVLRKAIMSAEMSDHLGYRHSDPKPAGQTNQRNGTQRKEGHHRR